MSRAGQEDTIRARLVPGILCQLAKAFEDGKLFTHDLHRARACHLARFAVWSVPMDLAEKWMRKYRARWEETPPVWFTPEWREALPPQLCALLAAEGK